MRRSVVLVFLGCVLLGMTAMASPTDVPRILCVGDSWCTALQAMRCFETAFANTGTFEGIGQRGTRTTYVGVMADEFDVDQWKNAIRQELADYPTLDIVILSLGGNDFVDADWTPSMPDAEIYGLIDTVNGHVSNIIDTILAVRPNIRIVMCGYDIVHYEVDGATALQTNTIWAESERRKLEMVQTKERTYYLDNLGMMQHYFGIPEADPPIAANTLPLPGGYSNNYEPFVGGDINYYTSETQLLDGKIHLSVPGYDVLAQRCIDEYVGAWLSWPVVYEILPLGAGGGQAQFRVTFSESVTGVDATDFVAGGAATVDSVSGSGSVYTVTVSLNGEAAPGALGLVDDDTITDASSLPLGGAGIGNGSFTANGALTYTDPAADGTDDFDNTLEIIQDFCGPYLWLLDTLTFDPQYCDVNGGGFTTDPIGAKGNGMLDTCEFGLIRACLRATTLDLSSTGGITHAMALEAWNKNLTQMTSDLGGTSGRIESMIPGGISLFAGFMTLGDAASVQMPILIVSTVSTFTELPEGVSTPDPGNYTSLSKYLGPNGDADGDGATNKQEYDAYYPDGGKAAYISAALDPNITPALPCTNSTGGTVTIGESFCLYVPDPVDEEGTFEWLKDGFAMSDTSRISGTNTRRLTISSLTESDAGRYECLYNDGSEVFGPVVLTVATLPVAGPEALAALALLSTLAGAFALRKRG